MTHSVRAARTAAAAAALAVGLLPTAAFAYVGPGAGLSLLGALWALLVAVGLAVAFIVAWPVRRMLRRRRQQQPQIRRQVAPLPDDEDVTPQPAGTAGPRNA